MPFTRSLPLIALAAVLMTGTAQAQPQTTASHALLMDYDTGEALLCKNCDQPMPPSSMSKLMTVELVFQRLKDGRLKPTDTFHVSENAWRQGQKSNEFKMWVAVNSDVSVDDLLKGIIVQSGGDACLVVAEALAGSEAAFAEMMTERAKEIGLTNSRFANSSGLPDPNHYMTAEDLAKLARLRHPHLSGLLSLLRNSGIHLEQHPPAEPQHADRTEHRRRRLEDGPHLGRGLRHHGVVPS